MPPHSAACSAEANLRAALALLQALRRCGLRRIVLCPGSRSAPLAVAAGLLARGGLVQLLTGVDERSAAFLALGLGRADGLPAAVLTTSGTAAANLLPAVVEADHGAVPLLLLTADRPARLKGCGANQTVNQEAFLAPCCRAALSGDPAGLAGMDDQSLVQLARQAWAACLGAPRGAVHLNLPVEEPLHVQASDLQAVIAAQQSGGQEAWQPAGQAAGGAPDPAAALPAAESPSPLSPDLPGVVVAGPWRGTAAALEPFAEALAQWQRRSGWPVLADGLSGLRGRPGLELIHSYDLLLEPDHGIAPPGQLLRLGPMPASRRLQQWLAAATGPALLISEADPRNLDAGLPVQGRCSQGLAAWWAAQAPALRQGGPSAAAMALAARWRDLDGAAQGLLDAEAAGAVPAATDAPAATGAPADPEAVAATDAQAAGGEPALLREPDLARALSRALPAGLPLMLASSSPVRDWESFAAADAPARPVFGFRGASGIDGTLSLAAGLACSCGQLALLTGDLALLHDANGWLWRQQLQAAGARLCVLVIDNGGGGIFEQLPIRLSDPGCVAPIGTEPLGTAPNGTAPGGLEPSGADSAGTALDFERLFAMPQPIDHTALAAGYGVPSRRVAGLGGLEDALAWGLEQPMALLELRTDRRADALWRRQLRRRMALLSAHA